VTATELMGFKLRRQPPSSSAMPIWPTSNPYSGHIQDRVGASGNHQQENHPAHPGEGMAVDIKSINSDPLIFGHFIEDTISYLA